MDLVTQVQGSPVYSCLHIFIQLVPSTPLLFRVLQLIKRLRSGRALENISPIQCNHSQESHTTALNLHSCPFGNPHFIHEGNMNCLLHVNEASGSEFPANQMTSRCHSATWEEQMNELRCAVHAPEICTTNVYFYWLRHCKGCLRYESYFLLNVMFLLILLDVYSLLSSC